ncbi:MAG: PAS domain S-box protein [Acidobacteria bacterium]|nr:PAS domain S-box protein [Acidobacteriota bacterium]
MREEPGKNMWLWGTLLLSCLTILIFVFAVMELVEQRFFRDLDYRQLHYLYITRGMVSSVLLASWAVWFVLKDRRKSEEALRRSRERYRAMLANAADAIVLFDNMLHVLEWNPQAARLYGYGAEDVLGKPIPTLDAKSRREMQDIVRRLQHGEPVVELATKRINRSGEAIDVEVRISSFRDVESNQVVFLEMASDLREQIRMRQRALEMEKLTTIGRMAAGTAHTLNTPLGAMLLRIEMLQDRLRGHNCADELERLELSTRFCQDFVQKLLQYSRRSETNLRRLNAKELLDSVHTFFQPTFQVRQHTLTCASSLLREAVIWGDRNQLEALFAALLMNALDALPAHGAVSIGGAVSDGRVELFVQDNGSGVPDEKLNDIFEPFFTTKNAGHGTGLGLSIARNIVEEHRGDIELTNNSDGGVTVRVSLPLCNVDELVSSPTQYEQ